MSGNFDLVEEIESESDTVRHRVPVAQRPVANTPIPKVLAEVGGDAILRFVHRTFLSSHGNHLRQVAFCGVDSEDGSSAICVKAGRALASMGMGSVCLVETNLLSPHLSTLIGTAQRSAHPGATSSREQCVAIGNNLWLAKQDTLVDDCGSLKSLSGLKQRLTELRASFDFILIAAPCFSACGDTAVLGQLSDGLVLIVEANKTRRVAARKAKEAFEASSVRLLGTILYNRVFPIPKGIYERL